MASHDDAGAIFGVEEEENQTSNFNRSVKEEEAAYLSQTNGCISVSVSGKGPLMQRRAEREDSRRTNGTRNERRTEAAPKSWDESLRAERNRSTTRSLVRRQRLLQVERDCVLARRWEERGIAVISDDDGVSDKEVSGGAVSVGGVKTPSLPSLSLYSVPPTP